MIATRSTCNTFHVLLFQPKSVVSKRISIQVKIQKACWEKGEGQVGLPMPGNVAVRVESVLSKGNAKKKEKKLHITTDKFSE